MKFDWKTELGQNIVSKICIIRDSGIKNWNKIAKIINEEFNLNFHKDKIRRAWRTYASEDEKIKKGNKTEVKFDGNNIEIDHKGKRIKTLDDLIKECNIDLNIWKIDKHSINKWEVGTKNRRGEIIVEPLYQVSVSLSKIIPTKQLFPAIESVSIQISRNPSIHRGERDLKIALIIPDSQIGYLRNIHTGKLEPFHDRYALDIAVQMTQNLNPDRIILLGDMLDLTEWSDKFIRSPEFYWTTQPALMELAWWLGCLVKAAPEAEIDYLEGNHENRLKIALINHLIASYDLKPVHDINSPPALSIPFLLGLEGLGITYHDDYPKGEVWINNNLCCRHGELARKGGGNTVQASLKETFVSEIIGHVHRIEFAGKRVMTNKGAKTYIVFSPGTIVRLDGDCPSTRARNDWHQGLGIIYYEEGDGLYEIDPIFIEGGRALFQGEIIEGRDRLNDLKDDTGWGFF